MSVKQPLLHKILTETYHQQWDIKHLKLPCTDYRCISEEVCAKSTGACPKGAVGPVDFELLAEELGYDVLGADLLPDRTTKYGLLLPANKIMLIDKAVRASAGFEYRATLATLVGMAIHVERFLEWRFLKNADWINHFSSLHESDRKKIITSGQVMAALIGARPPHLTSQFWSTVETLRGEREDMQSVQPVASKVSLDLMQLRRIVERLQQYFNLPALWLYRRINCSGLVELDLSSLPGV